MPNSIVMNFPEQIKEQMNNLTKYKKGQSFSIMYVERGKIEQETKELDFVEPFSFMKFSDGTRIPFLGNNIGVMQIFANGFKVYENRLVDESYDMQRREEIRSTLDFPKIKKSIRKVF